MTQQDNSATAALAAELRRIVEQAEDLMAAAGAEQRHPRGPEGPGDADHRFGARKARSTCNRKRASAVAARPWPPNPGSRRIPGQRSRSVPESG